MLTSTSPVPGSVEVVNWPLSCAENGGEGLQPRHARVATGSERMDERNRPADVGEPVQQAPRAIAEAGAQQARDGEGEQQVERDGAEPQPDRAVRGGERDECVLQRDR